MATILGGIVGIDRFLHHKPAGVRVLSLVSMGAAAISMVSVTAVTAAGKLPSDGVLRTIQGVLSGIGFLGAGVIMRTTGKDKVHGITTAATIFVVAILGMVCGLGQWQLSICTFIFCCLILVVGKRIESHLQRIALRNKQDGSSTASVDDSDESSI